MFNVAMLPLQSDGAFVKIMTVLILHVLLQMKITYCSLLLLSTVWSFYRPNLALRKSLTMFSNCRHPVTPAI